LDRAIQLAADAAWPAVHQRLRQFSHHTNQLAGTSTRANPTSAIRLGKWRFFGSFGLEVVAGVDADFQNTL